MGGIRIDFSEVEDQGPLPEGRYEVICEDCTVRESKSSDNDYLNFEFRVVDEEYEDRRIWIGASLSPNALFGLEEVLVAMGAIEEDEAVDIEWADDVDITPKEGPQVTNPEVIGLPACIATVNSTYNNRERQDQWNSKVEPTGSGEGVAAVTQQPAKASKKAAKGKARKRNMR
jgi:hypothetical protein